MFQHSIDEKTGLGERARILLFQKVVPSYRLSIFRALSECYKVIVCHSKERKNATWNSSVNQMDFPHILLLRWYCGKSDTNVIQNVFSPLVGKKTKIVISEYSLGYLSFWMLFLLKPFFGYKLAVWTHGVANSDVASPFSNMPSKIDLFVYRRVDAILLYCNQRKQILAKHLGAERKLFVAQNTLDTGLMEQYRKNMTLLGRAELRRRLGFKTKFNLIYIGRLLKNKRIDLLLQAFELLAERFDVSLHIIGDGPERNLVASYKMRMPSLYSHGAIYDEEVLGRYIFASDLLVNPGTVGLSIVHSFAYGTPIVTFKTDENGELFHSPEIEYLKDGTNGIYCELSASSIAENVAMVLEDEKLLHGMSEEALKTATQECGMQNMIKGFEELISYLQK